MGSAIDMDSVVINEEMMSEHYEDRKETREVAVQAGGESVEIREVAVQADGESVEINTGWVETNEEFPMNYYVMESVGLDELDNFFNDLVPGLRNLKKAQYEIRAKTDFFIRITEADLLANYTLNDAIMSMIYCLTASNGIKTKVHSLGSRNTVCECCEFKVRSRASPYISFKGEMTETNLLIYKSWLELAEILAWTSDKVEPAREFAGALGIRNKLTKDMSEHINIESFNSNFQKLQVASEIAEETHNLARTILRNLGNIIDYKDPYWDIHPIATSAKQNRSFTPSEIVLRYWPEQSRVLGKVSQRVLRMNLVPAPVDEVPKPQARVVEESKQVASASEDNFTCLFCLSLAEDAVELSCCSTIMCEKCSTQLNSICPNCRSKFVAKPSIPIRRLIGNIAWRCTCGHSTTRSEMKSHLQRCPKQIPRSGPSAASNEPRVVPHQKRSHKCRFKACSFSGGKAALKAHIASVHAKQS
jgi:hypothetical protein